MKADVLSQSNLKISKVSRVFGSFWEILFIVSPLDHLFWAKSRDLENILDHRIVANMFYTTMSKQVVKSLNSPTLLLCSNSSNYSQHHCGTQPATSEAVQVCLSSQTQIPISHSNVLTYTNNKLPHIQKTYCN